jgi:asparagine synthase (glutamine-hydrolysing)
MCGIAGALNLTTEQSITPSTVQGMLALIRHRGPEAAGIHLSGRAALGHARLSIIDVEGGLQPIPNEDGTIWVVCNGEIFNYIELMVELERRGHHFRTTSDTEVIVHLYEELGPSCIDRLNGDFAFAIWDNRRGELLLARDRVGVRPLFYTVADGTLLFASEIKALLADPRVSRELDLVALDQIFTYWSTLPGRTCFRDVRELPAGHYLRVRLDADTTLQPTPYWNVSFPDEGDVSADRSVDDYAEELRALLTDAVRLRLRADVSVGAYLSGGLDSSATTALMRQVASNELHTFSIAFRNQQFDERPFQQRMARALGTQHHVVECDDVDIAQVFADIVWHCETPILRTSPAPMFMLARHVREHGLKVVLTGEGADEFFGGYGVFKEAKVRRWWASAPESRLRPLLLRRLHGEVTGLAQSSQSFLQGFFGNGLHELDDPCYSHLPRWRSTARQKRFFSPQLRAALSATDTNSDLTALLDGGLANWDGLSKAQYIEAKIFLSQYLLSSQGDRVAMAHAVEGRFPFLDHRLIEFAATIPSHLKLRGLNEKYILKRSIADLLPPEITARTKQPYRAPISTSFFAPAAPSWVADVLSEGEVKSAGLFDPAAVSKLVKKCQGQKEMSEGDNMALVGIISAQLLNRLFRSGWATESSTRSTATAPIMVEVEDVLSI